MRDEEALRSVIEQYGDYLLRTAYLLLKDRQAAEEAVQDTFITAFDKIGQLQNPGKLGSWLTRITINRCRMKQRRWDWKHLFPFARIHPLVEEQSASGTEEQFMLEWHKERLSDAIHKLAYLYRESITLYYYNEMSIQEISGYLQANENTIKARLARGRAQLKVILEQGGVER